MGAKHTLRSSSSKVVEPSTLMINSPLQGRDESPSTEEQWIIPPPPTFLKTTCLIKVLTGTLFPVL